MKTDLSKPICIVGTGGFAREVLCCVLDVFKAQNEDPKDRVVFLDHDGNGVKDTLLGFPVLQIQGFKPNSYQCVVAIGNPNLRAFVVSDLPNNTNYITVIHPSAVISKWVEIGEGSIITAGCVLTAQIKIGRHAHLNLNTTVGHDTDIGDFFTTATNVSVSGICQIGDRVYMGSNSAIKQSLNVCDDVTIGMGAMLVKSADASGVYVGTPAKMRNA